MTVRLNKNGKKGAFINLFVLFYAFNDSNNDSNLPKISPQPNALVKLKLP